MFELGVPDETPGPARSLHRFSTSAAAAAIRPPGGPDSPAGTAGRIPASGRPDRATGPRNPPSAPPARAPSRPAAAPIDVNY